jgi:hypothetical protein
MSFLLDTCLPWNGVLIIFLFGDYSGCNEIIFIGITGGHSQHRTQYSCGFDVGKHWAYAHPLLSLIHFILDYPNGLGIFFAT